MRLKCDVGNILSLKTFSPSFEMYVLTSVLITYMPHGRSQEHENAHSALYLVCGAQVVVPICFAGDDREDIQHE